MKMLRQGSLFWFADLSQGPVRRVDQISPDHKPLYSRFFKGLMKRKLYMAPSGFEVGFIGYAHTQDVIEKAISIFVDAMDEALGQG